MAAADTARLIAELELRDKNFTAGLDRVDKKLGGLGVRATALGTTIGIGIERLAEKGVSTAVSLLGKSLSEASTVNEAVNKTKVVFGDASESVLAFSKTTADSLGLARSETLTAAGAFGNMFNTVGLTQDQSADFSKTLVTLAADMASFNDEDPSEMLDRLRSGLSGEAEPLRRFGVLLSEAAVKEEAYATGIAKRGDALTEAQKVQARYSLILKQTTVQQGDFARTSESLANVQRRLRSNLKDVGATIGTALLPKVTEVVIKFNKLITENGPAIQKFADALPGAFDKALAFAERIPWGAIGEGLKTSAEWAGKLFEVFANLPPEVQTTLIALAGLNKLSGGAITGIVSELGKGLIKGVLGITAATVIVKGGTIVGGGSAPLAPGTGAGAGTLGKVAAATTAATGAVVIATLEDIGSGAQADFAQAIGGSPAMVEIARQLQVGPLNITGTLDRLQRALSGDFRSEFEVQQDLERQNLTKTGHTLDELTHNTQATLRSNERLEQIKAEQINTLNQLPPIRSEMIGVRNSVVATNNRTIAQLAGDSSSERTAIANAASAQQAAQARTTEAARSAAAAIRDKDLSVSVQTNVQQSVSVNGLTKKVATYNRVYRVAR